jgi:transaldolase
MVNPIVTSDTSLQDALVKMSEYGFGCIIIVNGADEARGVFTDGDLRGFSRKKVAKYYR